MKNLRFILLPVVCLMIALNFVSCDKDDDKGVAEGSNELVGKWAGYFDGDDAMLNFQSNGKVEITFDYTQGGYPFTTTYSVNGQYLRIENLDDEYTLGTFSISDKVLTYTYRFYDYEDNEPTSQTNTDRFTKL